MTLGEDFGSTKMGGQVWRLADDIRAAQERIRRMPYLAVHPDDRPRLTVASDIPVKTDPAVPEGTILLVNPAAIEDAP